MAQAAQPSDDTGTNERDAVVLTVRAEPGRLGDNHKIAAALYISPKTASVHVSNICASSTPATARRQWCSPPSAGC